VSTLGTPAYPSPFFEACPVQPRVDTLGYRNAALRARVETFEIVVLFLPDWKPRKIDHLIQQVRNQETPPRGLCLREADSALETLTELQRRRSGLQTLTPSWRCRSTPEKETPSWRS
jgi:hypothetical protein